jgi:hypothetical protein
VSANPVGLVIAGIAALIAIGVLLWQNWDTVKDKTKQIWDSMVGVIRNPANMIIGIANGVLGAYENMLNGVGSAINSIPSISIPDWVPLIGGKTFSLPNIPRVSLLKIPSLDIGTNEVLSDGIAQIHKGESIVPANVAGGGYRGGNGSPINIYVQAMDFIDPEHVRKTAKIFGDQFAREVGARIKS